MDLDTVSYVFQSLEGTFTIKPRLSRRWRVKHDSMPWGDSFATAEEAAKALAERFAVAADVWSAPSYQQLRNEALSVDRWNRLHPEEPPRRPYVVQVLETVDTPIVAATDYMKSLPDMIRPWVKQRFVPLGTDGFGRSDTREALRRFFEVDAESIAIAALHALAADGLISASEVANAIRDLGVDPEKADPLA